MRRFSIFLRVNYYNAQIKNPITGRYLSAKSTGQTDESEALLVVADWLKDGFPEGNTPTWRPM